MPETASHRNAGIAKRALDLGIAVAVLTLASPLLVACTVWIKLASPGPVFFVQGRVGRDGRPFDVFKLRTMSVAHDPDSRSSVTVRNDPRVIRGGELMRRLKLDELPQLINVLRGEMSLVGPRPTVEADYQRMDDRQRGRCRVLPGLTGLAQVRGNTSLSWPERIEHDLEYVRTQSVALDLRVLAQTAALVLTARSHTDPPGADEWSKAA